MDQGVVDIPVTLVIKAPNQKYNDQKINCYQNWTVEKLKAHLSDVYPSKPSSKDQRLVYSGKLLLDHFTLKDVLRKHDEYHMLHLVCASRTPPASPKARSSCSNKTPQGPAGVPMAHQTSTNPSPSQSGPPQSSEGVRLRAHGPYYPMHPAFMHGYTWNQYSPHAAPPSSLTANPTYNNMTLMWWQQQYFHQYYMHYHAWAASVQQLGRDQAAARQSDASQPPPREYRHGDREAQADARGAGEAPNEDEENRDWLDWVYTMSRTAILISIVYFYSSFSRFVLVMGAILVLNLHQAGWFPFNLENDVHVAGDDVHVAGDGVHGDGVHVAADGVQQEDNVEDEPANADLHEREDAMDDALDEDEDDGGGEEAEEEAEDTDALHHANFLSTTWSFIITFFMSLIPEGPQNAAN